MGRTRSWRQRADAPRQNTPAMTSFFLSDSSPMIHYSAPNVSAWTTGYALQGDGWDSTVHLSSQSGSEISFDITATSLTLLIPPFANCTSTLTLNDSSPIPACASSSASIALHDLPQGLHRVKYSTNTLVPGVEVSFWGVDATRPYEGARMGNITVDSVLMGRGLRYEGEWKMEEGVAGVGNRTLASTAKKGARMELTGRGSAIYLYGNTGPGYSTASISLNGDVSAHSLNFSSSWASTYQLLWFRTGLNPSQESRVVMTNLEDKRISLDFIVLTTSQEEIDGLMDKSGSFLSTLHGKIIILGLVPLLALILLVFAATLIIRRYRRRGVKGHGNRPRGHKSLVHHESAQHLRPSYLNFESDTAQSAPPSKEEYDYQNGTDYPVSAPRSARPFGDELVVTYEEGIKRLSDRMRAQALASRAPPYSGSMDTLPHNHGTSTRHNPGTIEYALPSPIGSPAPFLSLPPTRNTTSPSMIVDRWSGLLRPIQHFLGGSGMRNSRSPQLTPNPHEGDMSHRAGSPLPSVFGTPTSASASAVEQAQYVQWSKATPQKGQLQPMRPSLPTSPLFHSSLPLSPPRHPFAQRQAQRQRPSDAPSNASRTSFGASDRLSVLAAPPSVRDMEVGDFQSVHTGRSGLIRGFFPRLGEATRGPDENNAQHSRPTTGPIARGKLPPTAFPTDTAPPSSISSRRKAPPKLSVSDLPEPSMTHQVDTDSPARPESTLYGLASPTLEATSAALAMQAARTRHVSTTSRSSACTAMSAARPDSDVIPFEDFVAGLREGQRRVQEERERARRSQGWEARPDGRWGRV